MKAESGKTFLMLDAGGTTISCGVMKGGILQTVRTYPALSAESEETILRNFASILADGLSGTPDGIGFAFPGPFDYERGISWMRGIRKYDAIYGVNLPDELRARLPAAAGVPMRFRNDVEAFAVGAYNRSDRKGKRTLCLCIGTGLGSAFLYEGKPVTSFPGVPENGWVFSTPFHGTILDNVISKKGLDDLSREVFGESMDGRDLGILASRGDARAMDVFSRFGALLAEAAEPFLASFHADQLILGGGVTGSFSCFGGELEELCRKENIVLQVEKDTGVCAMEGLLPLFERSGNGDGNLRQL